MGYYKAYINNIREMDIFKLGNKNLIDVGTQQVTSSFCTASMFYQALADSLKS